MERNFLEIFSILAFICLKTSIAIVDNDVDTTAFVSTPSTTTAGEPAEPTTSYDMKRFFREEQLRSSAIESYCSSINSTTAVDLNLGQYPRGYLTSHPQYHSDWNKHQNSSYGIPYVCKWKLIAPGTRGKFEDASVISFTFEGLDLPMEPLNRQGWNFGSPGFRCDYNFLRIYLIYENGERHVLAEFCGNGWVAGFNIPALPGDVVLVHGNIMIPYRGFKMYYETLTNKPEDFLPVYHDAPLIPPKAARVTATSGVSRKFNKAVEEACATDTGSILKGYSGVIRFEPPANSSMWCRWVIAPEVHNPSTKLKYIKFRIRRFNIGKSLVPCQTSAMEISFMDSRNVTQVNSFCQLKLPQLERWNKVEAKKSMVIVYRSTSADLTAGFELQYYTVLAAKVFKADYNTCGKSLFHPKVPPGYNQVVKNAYLKSLQDSDNATIEVETSPTTLKTTTMKTTTTSTVMTNSTMMSEEMMMNETMTELEFNNETTTETMELENITADAVVLKRVKRIVGGDIARPGSWRWVAMLTFFGYPICAATILNERWLLTAAHCFKKERRHIDGWEVLIGKPTIDNHNDVAWDYRSAILKPTIETVVTHFRYLKSHNSRDFDIALVKVEQPIPFKGLAHPVCPPSTSLTGYEICYVIGWGNTNDSRKFGYLNEALVPIIPFEQCRMMNAYYSQHVNNNMLCAGYLNGGVDNCRGDNGGPLVCFIENRWELHGIVSWGKGCARPGFPGVYTKVSAYSHWIHKVMNSYQ